MKRIFRQLCCFALAAVLIVIAAAPAYAAAKDPTPLIILQGYSGPQLFLDYGLPTEQQIWMPSLNGKSVRSLADVLLYTLPKLIVDAGGNADKVVEKFGEVAPLLSKMEMNDDGSPKYNVTARPHGAKNARWDVMLARGEERLNSQRTITNTFMPTVPADHIYCFANDWRLGQVEGSAALHQFIQEVKADSGHDKVNLFGISYGGQLAAAYLSLYGGEDIEGVVMHAPAIRGSQLTVDIMENESFAFDPAVLLEFAAIYLERELSINQRIGGVSMEVISDLALQIIRTYLVKPLIQKFGSFWDIMPPAEYERMKARYLDPVKNAELIRRSDIIHYQMMPNISETLKYWQSRGVKIALVCGANAPLVGGNMINSDRIIDLASTTGATVLPLGKKGEVDVPAEQVCANPAHPHRSPDGAIDASSCYLPDQTWIFLGQYHGQAAWDSYARDLYIKWLYTDEIKDVYSNPDYPQFRDSCNPNDGIEARFSNSVSGYLTGEDDKLLLKNLSDYELSLTSVQAEGLRLEVPLTDRILIRPGETVRLRYECVLPQKRQSFSLKVDFVRESIVPSKETRTFAFAALPSQNEPAVLRYPPQENTNSPLHFQPVRTLVIAIALTASMIIASISVGVIYRGKLRQKKRQTAPSE